MEKELLDWDDVAQNFVSRGEFGKAPDLPIRAWTVEEIKRAIREAQDEVEEV